MYKLTEFRQESHKGVISFALNTTNISLSFKFSLVFEGLQFRKLSIWNKSIWKEFWSKIQIRNLMKLFETSKKSRLHVLALGEIRAVTYRGVNKIFRG